MNHILPMPETEQRKLKKIALPQTYPAGTRLLSPGELCTKMRFIISGMGRAYFIDPEGKEFTWSFHYANPQLVEKNLFIVDYHSFLTQSPSQLYIEAIDELKVLEIEKSAIDELYAASQYWNQLGRIITENVYLYTHNRTLSLLTQSAKERYEKMRKDDPLLISMIPQYLLASYLGVTPESLSRLKKSS